MREIKIRMCVVCKKRDKQYNLYRLQCQGELVLFTGRGRSFYVCDECIDSKKFVKYISKICKINKETAKEKIMKIKEFI